MARDALFAAQMLLARMLLISGGSKSEGMPMTESDNITKNILANASKWEWPFRKLLMPKPWDEASSVLESSRHSMTRLTVQAKVAFPARMKREESVAYRRVHHWVPRVEIPDEFYGYRQVVWKNIYECGMTSDGQVRMEFIKPDRMALTFIKNRGSSVDGETICRVWQENTEEIARDAAGRHPEFRLDEESVHIFAFDGLAKVNYRHGMKQYEVWFNFGNDMVYVEKVNGDLNR